MRLLVGSSTCTLGCRMGDLACFQWARLWRSAIVNHDRDPILEANFGPNLVLQLLLSEASSSMV